MRISPKYLMPLLGVLWLSVSVSAFANCDGIERWFVKVGTDPDASLVKQTPAVPITVKGLNQLPNLQGKVPHGDNKFRLPEERTVYKVNGRLVLYKAEADGDYHMVITDDSLKYTPGGPGTDGKETGTSFIAEIPNPACVAGKYGDPNVPSYFDKQLRDVRAKFNTRFPNNLDAGKNLGGIPVTLTGVAFYDRPHRQTGRAVNNIELHPILDISFNGTPTTSGTSVLPANSSPKELLVNSGFEDGTTGWSGTLKDIGHFPSVNAHQGSNLAWMGGIGDEHTESLYQSVSIPTNAQGLMLTFWVNISSEETTKTKTYDKLEVRVLDSTGHVKKKLATYSNLDHTQGFDKKTFDVSRFAGQHIRISFKAIEDKGKATSFWLDDVALTMQQKL